MGKLLPEGALVGVEVGRYDGFGDGVVEGISAGGAGDWPILSAKTILSYSSVLVSSLPSVVKLKDS